MITISKTAQGYLCSATPPHVRSEWTTSEAMTVTALIDALRDRGAHQTDIGDAFYAADPQWLAANRQVN